MFSKHMLATLRVFLARRGFSTFAISPSTKALERSQAVAIVNSSCEQSLSRIASKLATHAIPLARIDPESYCSVRLVVDVCEMAMDPSTTPNPFKPIFVTSTGGCSFNTTDLSAKDLLYLAKVYALVQNNIVRSRLADVVWSCSSKRDRVIAHNAIENYLSLNLESDRWHQNKDIAIRRGLVLAKLVKANDLIDGFEQNVRSTLQQWQADIEKAHLGLFDVISEFNLCKTDYPVNGSMCESLGNMFFSQHKFNHAFSAYELAAGFVRKNNKPLHFDYLKLRADCMRVAASHYMHKTKQYPAAEKHYSLATKYYRAIPNNERHSRGVDKVLEELPFQQRLAGRKLARQISWINSVSERDYLVDNPETHELYKRIFATQDHPGQILVLAAQLFVFPNYEKLRANASESLNSHFFSSLMGSAKYASDGRQEAQINSPGLILDGSDDVENNINQKISENHRMYMQNLIANMILPGIQATIISNNFTKQQVHDICRQSVVLRSDRLSNATSALYSGLQLRFSESLHLCVPLLENIVRDVLRSQGKETSRITENGVQIEHGLSGLIESGQMEPIFGKNITFSIWSYFTNHMGPNLRNEIAHGLANDISSKNLNSIYAWWFLVWVIVSYHPPYSYIDYIGE